MPTTLTPPFLSPPSTPPRSGLARLRLGHGDASPAFWPPTASSDGFFPYDCHPHASNTSLLLSVLADPEPPNAHAIPPWVHAACPEVTAHFANFPYFPAFHRATPVSTTAYAAAGVCSLKVLGTLAATAGAPPPMLHAGSHLGAMLHGGPIPWDDDIDALMPWQSRQGLLAACAAARHAVHPSVTLLCKEGLNAIKVCVRPRGLGSPGGNASSTLAPADAHWASSPDSKPNKQGYCSPFVDLFLYKVLGDQLAEVRLDNGEPMNFYPASLALPPRPRYYFGGLTMPGPAPGMAAWRYDISQCVSATRDHRFESRLLPVLRSLRLDCCALARAGLPFVVRRGRGRALVGGMMERAIVVDGLAGEPAGGATKGRPRTRARWVQATGASAFPG